MAVAARLTALATGLITKGFAHGDSGQLPFNIGGTLEFKDGIGAGQADRVFSERRTIAAGGNLDLDLSGGGLVNEFGDAVTFAKVKAISIKHASGVANAVIGNGATPFLGPFGAAAHTIAIPPGGAFSIGRTDAAGWPVTNTTADILRINNPGGASIDVDICIVGTSA